VNLTAATNDGPDYYFESSAASLSGLLSFPSYLPSSLFSYLLSSKTSNNLS